MSFTTSSFGFNVLVVNYPVDDGPVAGMSRVLDYFVEETPGDQQKGSASQCRNPAMTRSTRPSQTAGSGHQEQDT